MCRFPSHFKPGSLRGKVRQIRQKVQEMREKLVGRDQHPPGILRGNDAAFEQGIMLFLLRISCYGQGTYFLNYK